MFPTLKCSSLRSRPHQKGISLECVSAAESKPYDDMKITCSPIEKFTSCSSQNGNRNKTDCKAAANQQNYFNVYKDYSDCSIHSDVYTQTNDKYRYSSDDSFSQISSTTKITDVMLEKDEEGSLGITLQGGVHPNPEYSRPIFITYVKPDGPADKEGTIQTGDRLMAIDGYALSDVSLSETYALLRQLYGRCTARLTIEYDVTLVGNFTGPMLVEMESPRSHQLGLTLTNTPYNAAVLIDEIRTGSIAERCGALHAGDQILAVNETRVEGSKIAATEVYKMLRQCGGTGSILVLEVLPFNEFAKSQLKSTDFGQCDYYNIPAISQYLLPYSAASRVAPFGYNIPSQHYDVPSTVRSKPNNTKQMTLTLHSNDKVGYGLSVFCLPNNPKIIIHSLTPEGPAERSEVLQIGDEILTVNDCPLTGVTSDPQPLHKVPGITLGTVVLQIEYGVTNRSTSNDDIISIALNKYSHNKNLGIVLTDYRGFIIISSIKAGSVADRCGALSSGDTILSVNSQAVSNCPVQDVTKMLEEELDSVVLEVKKVGSGFDSSITENGSDNVEYTVELNKQGGTLGITITGSDNSPRQILISAVIPGGLAERTGALHVGDRVLAIDNNDTSCVLLSQAIGYLQNAKEKVFIKVSRSPLNSQITTASLENDGRAYGSPGLYSVDSAVESWESSQEPSSSSNEIPIPFHQNHQLPANYKHDDCDVVTEDHVLPTVVLQTPMDNVHRYGSLQRLRQPSRSRSPYCNPSSFKDNFEQPSVKYDYSTLNTKRNNEENEDTSSLDRNVDLIFKVADMDEERDNENEVYRVTLQKDPLYDDFGFSVSDGLYERGVFINRIRKGGPADNSGVLRPYDRIIQVNGIKTDNFDCCLTVPLVAAAGNKVTLKVTRKKLNSQQQGR